MRLFRTDDRMKQHRYFTHIAAVTASVAFIHGMLYWSATATFVLFTTGALIGFGAEVFVISRGWLEHHVTPAIAGVPLYILCGWVTTLYLVVRAALLVASGWQAVLLAGAVATGYDMIVDHIGVRFELWSYTGGPPGPALGAVPWWNFAGWMLITVSVSYLSHIFL